MILFIEAKPGAKKNELLVVNANTLNVKINAPALDGKANEAIVLFLCDVFKTSKSKIKIIKGHTSKFKKINVELEDDYVNNVLSDFI
jgi:uncharacterized protein (TIGR00251 family)